LVAYIPLRIVVDRLRGRFFWGVQNARVLGKGGGSRAGWLGPNNRIFEENPTVEGSRIA
jgi:hypothetical protein